MILHTVNKSPLASGCLIACLRFVVPGDAIVLLEDGVYAAGRGVDCGFDYHFENTGPAVYAVSADIDARGLTRRLRDNVGVIDYDEFVSLCTQYDVIKNWS